MDPINLFDMEALAKQTMPHNMWTFVDAASNDEITKRRNRDSFERILVNARFLADVSDRDLTTTVLGEKSLLPSHGRTDRRTAAGASRRRASHRHRRGSCRHPIHAAH